MNGSHYYNKPLQAIKLLSAFIFTITLILLMLPNINAHADDDSIFPIEEPFNTGTPGEKVSGWANAGSNGTGTYTNDGWLRLTGSSKSQNANIMWDKSFPASTGFDASFDYRAVGRADGLTLYLVDGNSSVSSGNYGGALGYVGLNNAVLGLGLDLWGNFSKSGADLSATNSGANSGKGYGADGTPSIALRGSGTPATSGTASNSYQWIAGKQISVATAQGADPSTTSNSNYYRVRVNVIPTGINRLAIKVSRSELTRDGQEATNYTEIFASEVDQTMPPTLKLGFSASTGAESAFLDIRDVVVTANSDLEVSSSLTSSAPKHEGVAEGTYLPGDKISFSIVAKNNGPSDIGTIKDQSSAYVAVDFSKLPIEDVQWECTPANNATCLTGGGSGNQIRESWSAKSGSSVELQVTGTVTGSSSSGKQEVTSVIPTDFDTFTVDGASNFVQPNHGLVDSDTTNNTATTSFEVNTFKGSLSIEDAQFNLEKAVAGTTGTYIANVKNTGNTAVNDLEVSIEDFSGTGKISAFACDKTTLAASETSQCTVSYTLTQEDVDSGSLGGTVTAKGQSSLTQITGASKAVTTSLPASHGLDLQVLTDEEASFDKPGDQIDVKYTVKNTSNVTIDQLTVSADGPEKAQLQCSAAKLSPNQNSECSSSYLVTQEDLDRGDVTFEASGTGMAPGGNPVSTVAAPVSLTLHQIPNMSVVLSASNTEVEGFKSGEDHTYTLLLTNIGNVTLNGVGFDVDNFNGSNPLSAWVCQPEIDSLAPNEQLECTSEYPLTQEDVDRGNIELQVTGMADQIDLQNMNLLVAPTLTKKISYPDGIVLSQIGINGSVTVDSVSKVGDVIVYRYQIINEGYTTVSEAQLERTFEGTSAAELICPNEGKTIAPGYAIECESHYEVVAADLKLSKISDRAKAVGTDSKGAPLSSQYVESEVLVEAKHESNLAKTGATAQIVAASAALFALFGVSILVRSKKRRS